MMGTANIRHGQIPGGKGAYILLLSVCIPAIWLVALMNAQTVRADDADRPPFRLAFSASMFSEVNEGDARAAMKVWIMTVASDMGIPVDPDPHIQHSIEDLVKFGKNNAVSGFCLTTPEIPRLNREIKLDRFAVGVREGKITEEYLLLVRRDSGIERIDQLRRCSINILSSPRMSLAPIWLDTLLLGAKLGHSGGFFGRVTHYNKSGQVILPVFFGKTEACLITRAKLEMMGELNPQLNIQLKVLAASPALVPTGFAFVANPGHPVGDEIMQSMEHLGDTPAGRQILMLTQSDRIEARPLSCLDGSFRLLNKYQRLCRQNGINPIDKLSVKLAGGAR